ncbi:MAG: hypothetical protein HOC71_09455 [Candidatus Latescibacteria bacterium]|jgi:uncharacterized phosphosugar-binding protein|nr:hypothetical protein [Candidatus Latescibacterota bacterium]
MKRRDAIRILPLSIAGMAGHALSEKMPVKQNSGYHEPLSMRYVTKVIDMLTWIRENQSENLLEASYAIADTVQNGGQCWQSGWDAGHTQADLWPGRNGEPEIFKTWNGPEDSKDGDLLITGSSRGTEEFIKHLTEKDIVLVSHPSPWSGDAKFPELVRDDIRKLSLKDHANIWIETNNSTLGGIMYLPGMPAPIGPVSAVIGKVTIWMMIADACRILARRGISLPVRGDEPELSEKVDWKSFSGWVSLYDPLMDNYFKEVITQLKMIRTELGNIRKIGKMAADSVIEGGTLYGYSRYTSIAGEANTRRAGLALTRGIYGRDGGTFKGSSKDCVIMGITKPDDEIDLHFFDEFKKSNMRIASIGPMTRNIIVPEGRAVHKETEVHVGRMCDTYGLFAVPGFAQKICPTSGVVINQLFWACIMEFAEQFIERTGNVPAVYYSGALKGGMEHYIRMQNISNEQGY